jgi:hypothetical protein
LGGNNFAIPASIFDPSACFCYASIAGGTLDLGLVTMQNDDWNCGCYSALKVWRISFE